MRSVSVLIKPISGSCNLNCKYCFYNDIMSNRSVANFGKIDKNTTENIIKKVFDFATDSIHFAFQGGEPTLIGLDYYKQFVDLVEKYNTNKLQITYAIQTNGILVDSSWCDFFYKNNFLVGLSLDGPKDINDLNRVDFNNDGSFRKVSKAIDCLNKYKVSYNILTVVTKSVTRHITKVYSYFKKNNFSYLQFIPCIEDFEIESNSSYHSISPEKYGDFLCKLFDLWYSDFLSGTRISIRYFDNILQLLLGYRPESCIMNGFCSVNPIIESDGSVYPCDFYVLDKWRLGNINDSNFSEIIFSEKGKEFICETKATPLQCLECEFNTLCASGGCRRYNEPFIDGKINIPNFCSAYKEFFKYTLPRFKIIANHLSSSQ